MAEDITCFHFFNLHFHLNVDKNSLKHNIAWIKDTLLKDNCLLFHRCYFGETGKLKNQKLLAYFNVIILQFSIEILKEA